MLAALLAAALAVPGRCQASSSQAQPAVPAVPAVQAPVGAAATPAVPDAPRQPGVALTPEERQQQAAEELRRAVFISQPRFMLPSYQDFQRQREQDELAPVGHRVVTDDQAQAPANPPYQAGISSTAQGWKEHSVQLTFARPLPGVEAGVGMTERREWIGNFRTPNQRTTFAFIRIPLGKPVDQSAPKLFLPEARVVDTTHAGSDRTTVDNYSIRDLPPGLIP